MTERVQRFLAMQAEQDLGLGPRQVRLRASTEALGRDGLVVVTRGIDLGPYKTNPVMLFDHDPKVPVARAAEVTVEGDALTVLADFAPEGVSARSDEICGLVKAGILNGVSIQLGFNGSDVESINPTDRSAGKRITRSELYEISFVSVQAERNSLVTGRADGGDDSEHQFFTVAPELVVSELFGATEERAAESVAERAGAKHSAATRAKMAEACQHMDNAMRCMREMIDEDAMRDMDESGDEMRGVVLLGHPTPQEFSEGLDKLIAAEKSRRKLALRIRVA